MNNINPISFQGGRYTPKKSLKKTLKSFYYAAKPVNSMPKGPEKLPLGTRIVNFFKSLINANKDYFIA